MGPEPKSGKPEDAYARALKEEIVKDAEARASEWTRSPSGRPPGGATARLVLGLSIMVAGLVLALDSLGLLDATFVFRFWPLILIAVGIVKWQTPYQSSSAFVWIVAGIALLFMTVGHMPASRLWAAMLFFVGANIAWRALRPTTPRGGGDPASYLNLTAVLGGTKAVSHSSDFRGGQAFATLGGCEIDLRHASIAEGGEAVIDTFAFWGGIEIKVPEDWQVVNRGSAFLGAMEDKTRPIPGATKRLVVTGTAIMGGVEVKN